MAQSDEKARRVRTWWRRVRQPRRLTFTSEGRYFVFLTVGLGLAAINTGNNLLYLLLGWLLSVIIASGVLSDLTLRGLSVVRRPPTEIYANKPFLMELAVTNEKSKIASFSLEVEDLAADGPLDKRCYFLKVPPGKTQHATYRHTFSRRGVYKLEAVRIATRFPFSLFRKSRDRSLVDEIIVFPRITQLARPAPRGHQLGETAQQRLGRRGEFMGLREYREGDDHRDIHWRSTARTGRALVREFEEETHRRVTLLIDNGIPQDAPPSASDAFEAAIEHVASLAASYLRGAYQVRLLARGTTVPFGLGPGQLVRVLKALATLPTVHDEVGFPVALDPRAESILVVAHGVAALPGRPVSVSQVIGA